MLAAAAGGTVWATQNVTVSGEHVTCEGTGAAIELDANATLTGTVVSCQGGEGGSVELNAAGATVGGAAVNVQADAGLTMAGNPINVG